MQDSVQLEELILIKDGIEHRVAGFFFDAVNVNLYQDCKG